MYIGGFGMSIKELDRKIDDSLLQVFKCILLDIIFSIFLLKLNRIEGIIIFFPILLCEFLSTFQWIDKISVWKRQRKELEEAE